MRSERRFTLIELLAVFAIITILAGLIVAASSFASRRAAEARTLANMKKIELALENYLQDRGYFPQHPTPCVFYLRQQTTAGTDDKDEWTNLTTRRPYLDGYPGDPGPSWPPALPVLRDGWEQPFYYQCPGTRNPETYDLWSKGQDKLHGVSGTGKDQTKPTNANELNADSAIEAATENCDDINNWKKHL